MNAGAGAPAGLEPITHLPYLHGFRSSPKSTKARKFADWVAANRPRVEWIVSVPGDCPFLPRDLVAKLHAARITNGKPLACAHSGDWRHPVVGLWHVALREDLRHAITVEDLLTMRAGLQSTSFDQYGSLVTSRNWVRHSLTRPVVASRGEGAPMIYSTGSTHLLSAVLTRATKQSTHAFARRSLAPLGIRLRPWTTDPQGVFFGAMRCG